MILCCLGDSCGLLVLEPQEGAISWTELIGSHSPTWVSRWLSDKNLPSVEEMQVLPLGQEDSLEKDMASYSKVLAWEISRTEELGWVQAIGSQKSRT